MAILSKPKQVIKCEGRFHELRDYLYNEAFPVVSEDRTVITEGDLLVVWDLILEEAGRFDVKDPYYNGENVYLSKPTDTVRLPPKRNHLSLVPLIESPAFSIENVSLIKSYASTMENSARLSAGLSEFGRHSPNYLERVLGINPAEIDLPEGNLKGYVVSSDYGIGTIIHGGIDGGGIRSDSPFLLGVYEQQGRGQLNLAAVVGFWAQDNNMLVSQIQSCKNGHFPKGVQFGVGALSVAEAVGRKLGFKKISTYSARNHPIFQEHPEDWRQFGKDFVCIYDNSAKKLGFDGGRHEEYHEKTL